VGRCPRSTTKHRGLGCQHQAGALQRQPGIFATECRVHASGQQLSWVVVLTKQRTDRPFVAPLVCRRVDSRGGRA
jgi:hypothetical protein